MTGVSGAVQTSLFGLSGGTTVTDTACQMLKLFRALYGAQLKVAAVSLLCQDARVWTAMDQAGTPCPYDGQIGLKAKALWLANPTDAPKGTRLYRDAIKKAEGTEAQEGASFESEYPE